MKIIKTILIILAVLIAVFIIIFAIYLISHRQSVIASKEISQPSAEFKVLIASQGSPFKNTLVDSLVSMLREKPINIRIIDVTELGRINETDWNAFILIHTTEKWQLQPDVKAFLNRAKDLNNIILVATSGDGKWKTKDYDVDVITSASENKELSSITQQIRNWLNSRLK